MTKKNYSATHIRIFDKTGCIYAVSPNRDAYELVHQIVDILRDQTAMSGDDSPDSRLEHKPYKNYDVLA
jgi:hypothetical protein